MYDYAYIHLDDIELREGRILEIMVDQQGGEEVGPLPVQPLMLHILSSYFSHGFLNSVDIMHIISCGGGC